MLGKETRIEIQEVTLEWIRIASEVAQGMLGPEDGAALHVTAGALTRKTRWARVLCGPGHSELEPPDKFSVEE